MKHEPVRVVTQTIHISALDAKAQADARRKWEMFREPVYTYHDGGKEGRDICRVGSPFADDTRNWFVIEGLDEAG